MNLSNPNKKSYWTKILSAFFFVALFSSYLYTFAISSPYGPGDTLDPACPPGEANCLVQILPSQTSNNGKFLMTTGTVTTWTTVPSVLPPQATHNGEFLTTDGSNASWTPSTTTSGSIATALGYTPYDGTTNPNSYISSITSGDVTTALGFTPYDATNPSAYISSESDPVFVASDAHGISSTDISNWNAKQNALGFTPYNATNPAGYISGVDSGMVTTALGYTPYSSTNPSGYISGISSGMVTTALGFTPYSATNPNSYIALTNISGTSPITYDSGSGAIGINQSNITAVGTITSGTWHGDAIGATYGGTGISTYATGDLIYALNATTLANRTIGTDGQVLAVSGGVPVWTSPSVVISGAVLSDQSTPQTVGSTADRLLKLWATDITVTNPIGGSVTGNAGTVTGLSIASGKVLTSNNTLTLNGTDGSTLNIGTGGTLGTAAFTNAGAYLPAGGTAVNSSLLEGHNAAYFQVAGSYLTAASITGKEDISNKSQSILADAGSTTKYPSVDAVKTYADNMLQGSLNYRGAYDASTNLYPATGGSGGAGAVMKGDMWIISVIGTLGGSPVTVGDSIIAAVDTPGQTVGNWNILNGNITYVPENDANKVTTISGSSTNIQYPSAKLLYDQLALKQNSLGFTPISLTSLSAGTGITYNSGSGLITNSAPDQTVSLTAGAGVSTTGTYPNFTITNTSPDQTVAFTNGTGISVTGTYPNFTITNTSSGSGITSLNGLSGATQTFATGTGGTDFNISSASTTHTFNFPNASASNRGLLTSANWSTFNSKESAITAGTTGQYYRGDKSWQTLDKTAIGLSNVENTALSTWAGTSNVTTLGTITGGTWHGNTIGTAYGGTGLSTYTANSLIYASNTTTLAGLPIGTNNQVLTVNGGAPSWQTPATYESPLTFSSGLTRAVNTVTNDLITGKAGGQTVIGGTAAGDYLTYKSTTGTGTPTGVAHQFVGGTNGGTTAMTILNNGNVGVGTTAPINPLVVEKNQDNATFTSITNTTNGINASAGLYVTSQNQTIQFRANSDSFSRLYPGFHSGSDLLWAGAVNGLNIVSNKGAGTAGVNTGIIRFITSDVDVSGNTSGNDTFTRMVITNTGNIGIGTTNPLELLSLGTSGTKAGIMSMAGLTSGKVTIQPAAAAGSWTLTLPTTTGTSGQVLQTDGSGVTSWVTPTGGFTLPSLTSGSVLFSNGTTIAQDNSNFFWDNTNKRLGIGTVTPAYSLDVNNASSRTIGNSSGPLVLSSNQAGTNPAGGGYVSLSAGAYQYPGGNAVVSGGTGSNTYGGQGASLTAQGWDWNDGNSNIILKIGGASGTSSLNALNVTDVSGNSRFKVLTGGNVGIGTTSPSYKLDVNGSLRVGGATVFSATGGTITYSGGYTIHTFTSGGTFTPSGSGTVEYLVVGGGGGGGSGYNGSYGGGGGAGGFRTGTGFSVTAQAYTITVGAGGTYTDAIHSPGGQGGSSTFSTITAAGGGLGSAGATAGGSGGSGGGGSNGNGPQFWPGGAGNTPSVAPSQGNNGGGGLGAGTGGAGGGGGGAGGAGGVTTPGPGVSSSITGSAVTYAAGGTGGASGGGTANRGNGGNGGRPVAEGGPVGGPGGSGIVVIRYLTSGSGNFLVDSSGRVGIGVAPSTYSLEVGSGAVSGIVARFNNGNGSCDINPLSTALVCSSDISLKKNITTLDNISFSLNTAPDVSNKTISDKINYLTPVIYNWNSELDNDTKHAGFIAQQVQQIFPELVSTDPTTNLLSLNTTGMIPYMVKNIQELNLKVKDLNSLDITSSTSLGSLMKNFLADEYNKVDKIFAKTIITDGLEMKDSATGEYYCVMVTNGEFNKAKGRCGEVPVQTGSTPTPPAPTVDPVVEVQVEDSNGTSSTTVISDPTTPTVDTTPIPEVTPDSNQVTPPEVTTTTPTDTTTTPSDTPAQ